jgi:NitT/TauT family transport system ATP-binding protein
MSTGRATPEATTLPEAETSVAEPPTSPPIPAVRAGGLRMAYDVGRGERLPVLDGIDLTVAAGELVAVVGPSGCGKSTLLRILAGLRVPVAGDVEIDGRPPAQARRAKAVGLVLQEHALLPWRTALENVRLGLEVNRAAGGEGAAEEALTLVGLAGFEGYYPHQLSGGMRQRVSLARALALRPRLLLLDEPFAALDELTRGELGHELLRVWSSTGATVILVTHSVPEAVMLADQVLVLSPRPARVRADVAVDLPRPRPPDVDGSPQFARHVGRIKRLLRGDGHDSRVPRLERGAEPADMSTPSASGAGTCC